MRWVAITLVAAGCSGSPPGWHVSDGFLRDPDGRAAILRGVNLSGMQKNPPYFDFQQPPDYARVRDDWGMNAIRFLVPWAAIEPDRGSYDAAYLDAVAERIGWARDAGLSVILDAHQDIYGEGFGFDGAPRWTCDQSYYAAFVPRDPWYLSALDANVQACVDGLWTSDDLKGHLVQAWRRLAERLAGYDNVIGFEPMNEPPWGSYDIASFETDRLQPFYDQVVHAVRGIAPGWVAFLEPSSARNLGFSTGLQPFSYPNVVYAPHAYDSTAEGGGGFDPARRATFVGHIHQLADDAHALGAALWLGEYGGNADSPGIGDYMDAAYAGAGEVAAGSAYWDYSEGGGYSMLDAAGQERPALDDVLVRPYPDRIAGDPLTWTFDGASSTFTLTFTPRAGKQPTTIAIPPRVYPNGYQVDCGGCAFDRAPGTLTLSSAPPGSPALVTITPL